jgi:hypothetical protein
VIENYTGMKAVVMGSGDVGVISSIGTNKDGTKTGFISFENLSSPQAIGSEVAKPKRDIAEREVILIFENERSVDVLIESCNTIKEKLKNQPGRNEGIIGEVPMSEWISVKDRLPDETRRVLVADVSGSIEFCRYSRRMMCWMTKNLIITHWMPLHEPPEAFE